MLTPKSVVFLCTMCCSMYDCCHINNFFSSDLYNDLIFRSTKYPMEGLGLEGNGNLQMFGIVAQ